LNYRFLPAIFLILTILYLNRGSFVANAPPPKQAILHFYNWSDYISPEVLSQFTQETGIKVIESTYDSNETLYAKLKNYPSGSYDLIMPSTYFVSKMRREGMLQKIDPRQLKNFKHIDPLLLNRPFDPNNDYSIPYLWGFTGIGINRDEMNPQRIHSWADLWSPQYYNQLLVIDDARELFHIALRQLGYPANSSDSSQIKAAYQALRQLFPNILLFNSDAPAIPFIAGEVNVGMLWSGAAYKARQAGVPLQLIWPQEGAILWMDSLAIPVGAQHPDSALKLIDFILRPDIAAKIAQHIGYSSPNKTAKALLPKAMREDTTLYPDAKHLQQGEWQIDVGEAQQLYEHYFQKLKSGY
jgi:spermidine/putrescine transport system substrate-binding protein